jgi:ubiquinone/menaquinone biosynthesis C-methylase UbiE
MEKIESRPPTESDKFIFDSYIKQLQLSPEDFKKKILDIGAGSVQFAKWAEEQGISNNIFSLEPVPHRFTGNKPKTVGAEAQKIPFKDDSFDLVISAHAIPAILVSNKDADRPEIWIKFEKDIQQIILEMLRVVRAGGEIRIGPIAEGRVFKKNLLMKKIIDRTIASLISKGLIVAEEIDTGQLNFAGKKDIGYLIKIKKLM